MQPTVSSLTVDRGTDQLSVRLFPVAAPDAPLIVVLPAMGVPAGYYRQLAESLNGAGFGVAVADLRGTGESTPEPTGASRYGFSELADDVAAVLDALAQQRAGRGTYLLGHSLGGQAGVAHLARTGGAGVDGLILIAVGLPYWRSYPAPGRFGVLAFTQAVHAVAAVMRVWPGWAFGGRQARGVIRDWAYTARRGVFAAGLDVEHRLAGISLPVLAVSVDDDQYTPPATTDHLIAKLTGARVTRAHLARAEVEVPLDHFKWTRAGRPVTDLIGGWLAAVR